MTLLAGAFAFRGGLDVPKDLREEILRELKNSDVAGTINVHNGKCLFLAKWDSGAFGEPVWNEAANGSLSTLVGDPLVLRSSQRESRARQLERLIADGERVSFSELAKCRGSFSLFFYSSSAESITLATDAIGLRSTYYLIQAGLIIFASSLRILEALSHVRKRLCERGMTELSTFSFPLGKRTPYEGIEVLREAEVLAVGPAGIVSRSYYDWSVRRNSYRDREEASTFIHQRLKDAIRIRAKNDRSVYSFLSGGMDSRAIVATLIELGIRVEAMNFSTENSQDLRYAQLFSERARHLCALHCFAGDRGSFNFSLKAKAALQELEKQKPALVDRPQLIWSGDGGSVGLGHVYMDERMLDLAENGELEGAMTYFLRLNTYSPDLRVMKHKARERRKRLVMEGVMEEVNRYPRQDVGRRIYLFLLFNDQRRHLFGHWETIESHGLELITPFYDTEFLQAVVDVPARWGILHRLYAIVFNRLPDFARETPWQTYPRHLPCPVIDLDAAQLEYQWAKFGRQAIGDRTRIAISLIGGLTSGQARSVFSVPLVLVAAISHFVGLRDCSHLVPILQSYRRYESNCLRAWNAAGSAESKVGSH